MFLLFPVLAFLRVYVDEGVSEKTKTKKKIEGVFESNGVVDKTSKLCPAKGRGT